MAITNGVAEFLSSEIEKTSAFIFPTVLPSAVLLENIPLNGLISQFGVCGAEADLDCYAERFREKYQSKTIDIAVL